MKSRPILIYLQHFEIHVLRRLSRQIFFKPFLVGAILIGCLSDLQSDKQPAVFLKLACYTDPAYLFTWCRTAGSLYHRISKGLAICGFYYHRVCFRAVLLIGIA